MITIADAVANIFIFGLAIFMLGVGGFTFILMVYVIRDWKDHK